MNDLTIRALRYYAGVCMQKAVDPGLFVGVQIDYQQEAERATLAADMLEAESPGVIRLSERRR